MFVEYLEYVVYCVFGVDCDLVDCELFYVELVNDLMLLLVCYGVFFWQYDSFVIEVFDQGDECDWVNVFDQYVLWIDLFGY